MSDEDEAVLRLAQTGIVLEPDDLDAITRQLVACRVLTALIWAVDQGDES